MNFEKDELKHLKKYLASNSYPLFQKNLQQRISGFFLRCRDIPEYYIIYDVGWGSKVERYCGSCVEK